MDSQSGYCGDIVRILVVASWTASQDTIGI